MEDYDKTLYENKKMKSSHEQARMLLPIIQSVLSGLEQWDHDMLVAALTGIAQRRQVKNGAVMWPLRVAVTGRDITPGGATEIAEILGKEETLARVRNAMKKLEAEHGIIYE
ncbi:MAG: hypothetical protein R6W96_02385 [Clostridia bacterium]